MNPCRSVVTANGKNSLSVRIVEGSKILGRHTLTPHYVLLLFTAQELCQLFVTTKLRAGGGTVTLNMGRERTQLI